MEFAEIRKLVNEKDELEHRLLALTKWTDLKAAIQIYERIAEIMRLLDREMGLLDNTEE